MTFTLDTGSQHPDIQSVSGAADDTQTIRIRTHKDCDKVFKRIKENILCLETSETLDAYWQRETLAVDAIHIFDPFVADEITEIYRIHRAGLVHCENASWAQPNNPTAHNGKDDKGNSNGISTGYW